MKPHLHTADT